MLPFSRAHGVTFVVSQAPCGVLGQRRQELRAVTRLAPLFASQVRMCPNKNQKEPWGLVAIIAPRPNNLKQQPTKSR